jgi:hypothetical protein
MFQVNDETSCFTHGVLPSVDGGLSGCLRGVSRLGKLRRALFDRRYGEEEGYEFIDKRS